MPKCVIAEDEQLLRDALKTMLAEVWPDLDIVAACEDGGEALEAIAAHQPEVAFLDIRMPGLTGLEIAAMMGEVSPGTQVVFVTAYNQYAVDAFERGAIDYLLKPIARERLISTVDRLQSRMNQADLHSTALTALIAQLSVALPRVTTAPPLAWITASAGKETRLIMVEDIVYFQSDNKYTVVMTAEGESLVRKPLRELHAVLDPAMFRQIHRSAIVNMKAIASIARDETGKGLVKLRARPETLTISQPFMAFFRNM